MIKLLENRPPLDPRRYIPIAMSVAPDFLNCSASLAAQSKSDTPLVINMPMFADEVVSPGIV